MEASNQNGSRIFRKFFYLGILFGVLSFLRPGITLKALIVLFAAYALLNGIVSDIGAIRYRQDDNRAGYFQALYLDIGTLPPAKECKLERMIAMAEEWNLMEPESRLLFEAGDDVQRVEDIVRALYAKHSNDWEAIDRYREDMQRYANVRFGMLTDEAAPDHGVARKVMARLFEGYRQHFHET